MEKVTAELSLDDYVGLDNATELEDFLITNKYVAGVEFHHSKVSNSHIISSFKHC